jgi:hypothetical protein
MEEQRTTLNKKKYKTIWDEFLANKLNINL